MATIPRAAGSWPRRQSPGNRMFGPGADHVFDKSSAVPLAFALASSELERGKVTLSRNSRDSVYRYEGCS
jgi:hypothetical protein